MVLYKAGDYHINPDYLKGASSYTKNLKIGKLDTGLKTSSSYVEGNPYRFKISDKVVDAIRSETKSSDPQNNTPYGPLPSNKDLTLKSTQEQIKKHEILTLVDNMAAYSGPISTTESTGSAKFDDGKPRLASIFKWIDIPWLVGIMEVLEFGAIKYEKDNWKKGFEPERVLNGVFRHCTQFLNGETYDSESGKHHLLHAACGLMFAYFHAKRLEAK